MSGDLQRALGRNLLARRRAHDWSQDIMAEVLGVSRPYLSSVERGQRSVGLAMVERMATRLGLSPLDLLAE